MSGTADPVEGDTVDPDEGDDLRYCSIASVDGVVVTIWENVDIVGDLLGGLGRPRPPRGGPPGKHPICLEFWRVRADKWGKPNVNDSWLRPMRWWTNLSAGIVGAYREVMIRIPNVVKQQVRSPMFSFVPRMYTDSAIALWGDRALEYGFNKHRARISDVERGEYRVHSVRDGSVLLDARLLAPTFPQGTSPGGHADWLRQPLLGHLGGGRIAVSRLDRRAMNGASIPIAGVVALSDHFLAGLPQADHAIEPLGPANPWGAFAFRNVRMLLEYPRHAKLERDGQADSRSRSASRSRGTSRSSEKLR